MGHETDDRIAPFEIEFAELCKKHGVVVLGKATLVTATDDDPLTEEIIDFIKATPWAVEAKAVEQVQPD